MMPPWCPWFCGALGASTVSGFIPGGGARGNLVTTSGSTGGAPPPTKTSGTDALPRWNLRWQDARTQYTFIFIDDNILTTYTKCANESMIQTSSPHSNPALVSSNLSFQLDHLSIWASANSTRTSAEDDRPSNSSSHLRLLSQPAANTKENISLSRPERFGTHGKLTWLFLDGSNF